MPDVNGLGSRFKHAWNAFQNRDPTRGYYNNVGIGSGNRPDKVRLNLGNERSIVASIYSRIAIDVSQTTICHARLDENDRFLETIDSGLNSCLTLSANIDQTGKAFMQDAVYSMFDEGCVALVPVDTTYNPLETGSYDIQSLRTGKILQWHPGHVSVRLYNDRTGLKEDILLPKSTVSIVENPFYAVMNEPNSTLRRLLYKLNLLDAVDEQSSSGKLDLLIKLPYTAGSEAKKKRANDRRIDLETQLSGSKYGIAWVDGTESVTQLNRPVENNLMGQIQYLTEMLYSQLGLTKEVFDGTADDKVMSNYLSRTVSPIVSAFVDSMTRTFLTKTARSQKQTIYYFNDPFRFTPVSAIPEMADKLTRNEVVSSNEFRQIIGMKPSKDPKADELRNKNLSPAKELTGAVTEETPSDANQNGGR